MNNIYQRGSGGFQKLITIILTVVIASAGIVGGVYAYKRWVSPASQNSQENGKQENNNQNLPGSDRDEHGCIGSAGYSWCEAKQKCLRVWEEVCATSQDEQGIKQAFADKYKKSLQDIQVSISQDDGSFASGAVTFGQGGPGEGGYFFAFKRDGKWIIAADGNGMVSCQYLESFGFPSDIIKNMCFDEPFTINFTKIGNLVQEPVGPLHIWFLVYEEPGQSALKIQANFNNQSICDFGAGNEPCDQTKFEQGMRVKVEGEKTQNGITVAKLSRLQ